MGNKIIGIHLSSDKTQVDILDRRLDYKNTIFINCSFGDAQYSQFSRITCHIH